MKIGKIEDNFNVDIIDKKATNHDMFIGLDAIKQFKLTLKDDLTVIQRNDSKKKDDITGKEMNSTEKEHFFQSCDLNHLDESNKKKIMHTLTQNSDCFAKTKYDIGKTSIDECRVNLINEDLITTQKPYRTNVVNQKKIEEIIDNLTRCELIEESYSPFSAPVALVGKRDEGDKTRLVVNYKKLNENVQTDSYPFPRIEDILDRTLNCRFFTTLDVNSAFWTVKVRECDRKKLAFVTPTGHYQWKVMPFGFKNAPGVFQRILSSALKKHKLTGFSSNYMDDILIFSENFDEHIQHIGLALQALQKEGFKMKLSKCRFANSEIKYLGHKLSFNKVQPLNDNLQAIKEFPRPKTPKNVRQFIGKINYYHKFIPNCPKLLQPLYALLRKDADFNWTEECDKSFHEVKEYLIRCPLLAIYNPTKTCYIFTDASKVGLGAVLKQEQDDGILHPIGYFSMKNTKREGNQPPINLECRAIKEAMFFGAITYMETISLWLQTTSHWKT